MIGAAQASLSYLIRPLPLPFGLHSILLMFLFTLNILLVTSLPYRVVLLISLLGLIIYSSVETATAPLMLRATGFSLNYVMGHSYMRAIFFLPQALVMLTFIIVCSAFKFSLVNYSPGYVCLRHLPRKEFQKNLNPDFFSKHNLLIYVITLLPLILLVTLNNAFYVFRLGVFPENHPEIFSGTIAVFIIALTALSAAAVKKIGQYVAKEYAAGRAAENLKRIEQLVYSSRRQRHDFHHQLQTIYGLLESGACERARDYINRVFGVVFKTGNLISTDNLNISALLYTKTGLAEAKNIEMEINVEGSLKEIPLTTFEAESLLGNLIDNAIEAVEDKTGEHRRVSVKISTEHGVYLITVTNTGDPIDPAVRECIFRPGFTTKEGHPGLGLSIVKDIADRYKGGIDLSSDERETTFTVTIPF